MFNLFSTSLFLSTAISVTSASFLAVNHFQNKQIYESSREHLKVKYQEYKKKLDELIKKEKDLEEKLESYCRTVKEQENDCEYISECEKTLSQCKKAKEDYESFLDSEAVKKLYLQQEVERISKLVPEVVTKVANSR